MKYLAVLGRQPEISIAELEALLGDFGKFLFVSQNDGNIRGSSLGIPSDYAIFTLDDIDRKCASLLNIDRLGGCLKLAIQLNETPLEYLSRLPDGKITFGISDFSKKATRKTAQQEALKLKKILVRHGRSVRIIENKQAILSTATSFHNGLSGKNERKLELIKTDDEWYRVFGVQNIDAYVRRDQARPARDAKVGMLPPKLAQILINLCGPIPKDSVILDPFCGTGVVLQEALLMGYRACGTDISERMVEYSKRNLEWFTKSNNIHSRGVSLAPIAMEFAHNSSPCQVQDFLESNCFWISQGDAVSFKWQQPIDAVACEGYLGKPFGKIPSEMEFKKQKQECGTIVLGFLRNIGGQIKVGTPVVMAVPAWLRETGRYERLEILDEIIKLGYNVNNRTQEGLLYHRDGQVVARDILILRKK